MERSLWSCVGIVSRVLFGWLAVIYFLLMPYSSVAQVATKANEEYRTPAKREKAASEMAPPDRAAAEKTSELVKSLGLHAGDTIADVGTGVGHLLPFLESEIGTSGTIFAVDIFPEFIAKTRERITEAGWRNVHTVLGTERNQSSPQTGSTRQFSWTLIITSTTRFQQCGACIGRSSPADGFLS